MSIQLVRSLTCVTAVVRPNGVRTSLYNGPAAGSGSTRGRRQSSDSISFTLPNGESRIVVTTTDAAGSVAAESTTVVVVEGKYHTSRCSKSFPMDAATRPHVHSNKNMNLSIGLASQWPLEAPSCLGLFPAAACVIPRVTTASHSEPVNCAQAGTVVQSGYLCFFSCASGYYPRSGTSGALSCTNGNITTPTLVCQRMSASLRSDGFPRSYWRFFPFHRSHHSNILFENKAMPAMVSS
jgi:hypothetical protein